MICLHKRKRSTVIFLEPNHEQTHPVAVITVKCRDCGQEFEFFRGWVEVSGDRRELRVVMIEARGGMVQ